MLLGNIRGFGNSIFPLRFALIGGSFVFLNVGPFIVFLVFPFFWMLWFIYDCHGIIIIILDVGQLNVAPQKKMIDVGQSNVVPQKKMS